MQSGLWNPLITFARLSKSCIRRLRMIQWESLTRTASAPASYAPPMAALASPVMYRRQVWYSDPFGRTSSGSVTPEIPSISTEMKTFTTPSSTPPALAGLPLCAGANRNKISGLHWNLALPRYRPRTRALILAGLLIAALAIGFAVKTVVSSGGQRLDRDGLPLNPVSYQFVNARPPAHLVTRTRRHCGSSDTANRVT